MASEPIILNERNTPAASTVTCTSLILDGQVFHPPVPDMRTEIHRIIERHLSMPDTAQQVMRGNLELCYSSPTYLAAMNMYFNFANAEVGVVDDTQVSEAPLVFLVFPHLAEPDRDRIKYPVQWRAIVDRSGRAPRLSVVHRPVNRFVTIADCIFLGLDADGSVAEMLFTAVDWQD